MFLPVIALNISSFVASRAEKDFLREVFTRRNSNLNILLFLTSWILLQYSLIYMLRFSVCL